MKRALSLVAISALAFTACSSDDTSGDTASTSAEQGESERAADGIVVVEPNEAAATISDPPADLVILDVRTQEEVDEVRIDGATVLDFYRDDFRDELAKLDRDVPYVLYCRSGNRSGQTREMMRELGFESVQDVAGGIIGWLDAGLPAVSR